jgi:hypothetical protein
VPIIDLMQVTNQWTPTGAMAGEEAIAVVGEAMEGAEATYRGHKVFRRLELAPHLALEGKGCVHSNTIFNFSVPKFVL